MMKVNKQMSYISLPALEIGKKTNMWIWVPRQYAPPKYIHMDISIFPAKNKVLD